MCYCEVDCFGNRNASIVRHWSTDRTNDRAYLHTARRVRAKAVVRVWRASFEWLMTSCSVPVTSRSAGHCSWHQSSLVIQSSPCLCRTNASSAWSPLHATAIAKCVLRRSRRSVDSHTTQPDHVPRNMWISDIYTNIIRPPDIVVGGLIFYYGFFFRSSSFFVSYSPHSLNGTEPTPVTCSEVSAIWKCMSKICGIPSPYKLGAPKPPFGWLRNSTAILTAYIFGTKHDIHKLASTLQTTRSHKHWTQTIILSYTFYSILLWYSLY